MIHLMLITSFLAAPVVCPPDEGNIRWNEFTYNFTHAGKTYDVVGPLWDRDRNSQPSPGDLMQIETATAAGNALSVENVWVKLDGALAKSVAAHFEKVSSTLPTVCESRFEIEEVGAVKTDAELAKLLHAQDSAVPQLTPEQNAEKAMFMWAEERCNQEKYADDATLRAWLLKNGARGFADVGKPRLKKMAADVARQAGAKCAHLKGPKISF